MNAPPAPNHQRNGRPLALWLQAIALIGVPGAIAFYLLGMIPYTLPPIVLMQRELAEVRAHQRETRHLMRLVCYAAWAHYRDEATAAHCFQGPDEEPLARPGPGRPQRLPRKDEPPP